MTGLPVVVLDACVLVNASLCDTLLRLAEPPRLYEPMWSEEILKETSRTLQEKLGWPQSLVRHFESELRVHFSEAWIAGYDHWTRRVTNDPKDRHVLAAAVHARAPIILTFNLRHFRAEHLAPWGVTALHPEHFLEELFNQEPRLVVQKLQEQAMDRNRSLGKLLEILSATVPRFVSIIQASLR
jgi:predicted nucleic acid-binding protein